MQPSANLLAWHATGTLIGMVRNTQVWRIWKSSDMLGLPTVQSFWFRFSERKTEKCKQKGKQAGLPGLPILGLVKIAK